MEHDHFIRSLLSAFFTASFYIIHSDVAREKQFYTGVYLKTMKKLRKMEEKVEKATRTIQRSEKVGRYLLRVRETSRLDCLPPGGGGRGGKWHGVNANGRIPAGLLINFFAIITTARRCKYLRLIP